MKKSSKLKITIHNDRTNNLNHYHYEDYQIIMRICTWSDWLRVSTWTLFVSTPKKAAEKYNIPFNTADFFTELWTLMNTQRPIQASRHTRPGLFVYSALATAMMMEYDPYITLTSLSSADIVFSPVVEINHNILFLLL